MQIIHAIDDFIYTLFPATKHEDHQELISVVREFYTYGPFKPTVSIEGDWIKIEVDTPSILSQDADYKKVVKLSERGNYTDAKPILTNLIAKNPTNSEFHRIMGQILSDEGDQEEATNYLIDALRWDSRNGRALLMMGNIFAKFKRDIPTALIYYDQALASNPDDHISLTNIAYLLLEQGQGEAAEKYLTESLKINESYPNTHMVMAMLAKGEADLYAAFASAIRAVKCCKNRDTLYHHALKQAYDIAREITGTGIGEETVEQYKHKLTYEGDSTIDIVSDGDLTTPAKIEFAENYGRETHVVKYRPQDLAVEHLIMHELVHLDFVIQARKAGVNQLFTSDQSKKRPFVETLAPTIKKLGKAGLSEQDIDNYCTNIFYGLNSQVYNTPVDLFIEQFLYDTYPKLRPFQFISLYHLIQTGIKAVTDKDIIGLLPTHIISKSKVYNLINAIQYSELYGVDFTRDFQAIPGEEKQARSFYEEYLEYKDDREPGEEYELVQHWAEDLKLSDNFELVEEQEFRTKRTDVEELLASIEEDPYDLEQNDFYKRRELEKFNQSEQSSDINKAVVMYMIEALNYFEGMPEEEIREIAVEIAMQGTQGYSPSKDGYRISAIKGKTFSGYHILAYYYVSWALAVLDMLPQLGLPYEQEYKLALRMQKPS